jgi:hypothetical protein
VLGTYRRDFDAVDDDCLCLAPDVLGDAGEMERQERYRGRLYGRVKEDGGRTWLQYWFRLYYSCEAKRFTSGPMDIDESDGPPRPVVYVASLSHASYFTAGTHPYPVGIDHAYGDGPAEPLPLEEFGDWVRWPGHWGNGERAVGRRIGRGPSSRMHQGDKWDRPAAFHSSAKWRLPRVLLRRLLHFIGTATYPKPPRLSAYMKGDRRCRIEWGLRQSPWRRRGISISPSTTAIGWSRAGRCGNRPESTSRPFACRRPRPETWWWPAAASTSPASAAISPR